MPKHHRYHLIAWVIVFVIPAFKTSGPQMSVNEHDRKIGYEVLTNNTFFNLEIVCSLLEHFQFSHFFLLPPNHLRGLPLLKQVALPQL